MTKKKKKLYEKIRIERERLKYYRSIDYKCEQLDNLVYEIMLSLEKDLKIGVFE